MPIQTILFDADGVIQRPSAHRRAAWQALVGGADRIDPFLAALFGVERPAVQGRADFMAALPDLLTHWGCCGTLADLLAAWTMIEPDTGALETIRRLRRDGVRCHLASNQEPHRAAYMSSVLGYATLFEREFYSCHMGVAKPAVDYFRAIVNDLGVPPTSVLFLDDRVENVEAARQAGLQAAEFMLDDDATSLARTLAQFGIAVT